MTGIFLLKGTVKHYDWGGTNFIPALLKTANPDHRPFAEYWLGTHHLGISQVDKGNGVSEPLPAITGNLPYLLKAQEVGQMLSIQVHPSKQAAEKEFEREDKEGIPLDSPIRNYKDNNHKPELIVALGDFWLLHGFKPAETLYDILMNVAALRSLQPLFIKGSYAELYTGVMEMPQEKVNRLLKPLLDEIIPLYQSGKLEKNTEDFWAARAGLTYGSGQDIDRGIFSIYFFNLVKLRKGEGLFQDAGLPHAYLEGKNVEIMANSDNVLRGGLTRKHIDVKELLKHVKPEATYPEILTGRLLESGEYIYETKATEFTLGLFLLKPGQRLILEAIVPEILLITEGKVEAASDNKSVILEAGNPAAVLFPGDYCTLTATRHALVFRASQPVIAGE